MTRTTLGRLALLLLALALGAVAFMLVDRVMREQALMEEERAALDDAAILAASLRSELDKFSLLPMALAEDPQVRALLSGTPSAAAPLDRRLEALASQSEAAAIYVMDSDGLTLAASNWNRPESFVGSNYTFRRYFQDALISGGATQFALGTVSRKPGLYIASRVGPAEAPLGVVAVKVEFDRTEANWRAATHGVYVTDASGVVLITSEESYRFRLAEDAELQTRVPAEDLRQFGSARLQPLEIATTDALSEIVEVPLLDAQQPISPDGWVIHVLVDPRTQVQAAQATGRLALALLCCLLIAMALGGRLLKRRRQAREQAIVAQRTRTLREQLSQANRLATLGQISAGVNHEIGQPVAALRVYAESGEKLLAGGDAATASENFRQIVSLADRIGRITGELRRFSTRQPGDSRAMAIGDVIDGALLLLRDRLISSNMEVAQPPEHLRAIAVKAEHVRLEQVLVNLLQNALDASAHDFTIVIDIEKHNDALKLRVIDRGTGVSDEQIGQLFHPFATSKADGLGLGLVISRDIMRDMGGDLLFEPEREGTCFTMIIPRAA